jgi:peroxisomal 2,4-dienoyl-CoA reductase
MTSAFRKDLFKGRVVLATGGGSGIGQEVVRGLMQHGCDAVIIGRRKDVLEAAAKELEASTGQRCLAIPSDVRDIDKMAAAAKQCVDTFGRLDFVIAGAAGNFLVRH